MYFAGKLVYLIVLPSNQLAISYKIKPNCMKRGVLEKFCTLERYIKGKSRKNQGVFKVKGGIKRQQVREIFSQQLELKQVHEKGDRTRSGRVSVPC